MRFSLSRKNKKAARLSGLGICFLELMIQELQHIPCRSRIHIQQHIQGQAHLDMEWPAPKLKVVLEDVLEQRRIIAGAD